MRLDGRMQREQGGIKGILYGMGILTPKDSLIQIILTVDLLLLILVISHPMALGQWAELAEMLLH